MLIHNNNLDFLFLVIFVISIIISYDLELNIADIFPCFRSLTTIHLDVITSVRSTRVRIQSPEITGPPLVVFANSCCALFAASCHEQAILEHTTRAF